MAAIEVQITFPSEELAEATAAAMVETRLAACGQVMALRSIYRWEGQIEADTEWLLTLKTTQSCLPKIETAIRDAHPYDVPQITALAIVGGSQDYLDWIDHSVEP